jgi:hypothetical protein
MMAPRAVAVVELLPSAEDASELEPARRLWAFLWSQPGATIREARMGLALSHGAVMRNMNALISEGKALLMQGQLGIHLFPYVVGLDDAGCKQVVALRDAPTNDLYRFVWIQGDCREQELVHRGLVVGGAPRSFVRRRLRALLEARLLEALPLQAGRSRLVYRALPVRGPALRVLLAGSQNASLASSQGNTSTTRPK